MPLCDIIVPHGEADIGPHREAAIGPCREALMISVILLNRFGQAKLLNLERKNFK